MNGYKELMVWQKSIQLVKRTYEHINRLPQEERFALADQMRRSAISIPSNIAEGYERKSTNEYIYFLMVANGSRAELETQLEICKMLGYLDEIEPTLQLCNEIAKMINTIIKKLKSPNP